jgi:hypothetical protein
MEERRGSSGASSTDISTSLRRRSNRYDRTPDLLKSFASRPASCQLRRTSFQLRPIFPPAARADQPAVPVVMSAAPILSPAAPVIPPAAPVFLQAAANHRLSVLPLLSYRGCRRPFPFQTCFLVSRLISTVGSGSLLRA